MKQKHNSEKQKIKLIQSIHSREKYAKEEKSSLLRPNIGVGGNQSEKLPKQAGIRDKPSLPWCGGAFLQGGGSVGSIGEGTLRGHDQWEGDAGFTGALAVGVGHWHGVDTSTWKNY